MKYSTLTTLQRYPGVEYFDTKLRIGDQAFKYYVEKSGARHSPC